MSNSVEDDGRISRIWKKRSPSAVQMPHTVTHGSRACNAARIPGGPALLVLWAVCGPAIASPETDFHSRIVAIYNFEPYKLKKPEMEAKSERLDKFWSAVRAEPAKNLPLLRRELSDPSNSAFFSYDGAKLLLALSKDRDDQALALRSIPKADLRSIQGIDYLETVHWFAENGFDTREAAFRVLAFPEFQAFFPQHALTLDQDYSLIYMLFPMDESLYLGDLVKRLTTEKEPRSQKSLLLALWYTVTPAGDAALNSFVEDQKNPAEARAYAAELIAQKSPARRFSSHSSVSSLKEQRRKIMLEPISDESLAEFDRLTAKIRSRQ